MNRLLSIVCFVALGACTRLTPRVTTVNGRAVELVSAGSGATTVVFESGLGADWSVWDPVASEVARTSRVFASSRPGSGRSASVSTPRDATHIVEELREVLRAQDLPPPYVLVGHSFGGAYLELFARAHPDEVTALVLVEPRPGRFTAECEARGVRGCSLSPEAARAMPRVEQDEFAAFAGVSAELDAAGPFGDWPVRVMTATAHSETAEWEALWRSMHGALADEAVDGEQLVFEGAGHNLQLEQPREVVRVIDEVLAR